MEKKKFASFDEFWPFYLDEHSHPLNKIFHFIGTSLAFATLLAIIFLQAWSWLWTVPLFGYIWAWIGHFIIEKNRPATFKHPIWSLRGDLRMWLWILRGRIKIQKK